MAEEYWNRGRREGIQQSSALDTLERVLGIGSNIAGRVQANRDRRRGVSLKSIDYMTRGFENEYDLEKLNNTPGRSKRKGLKTNHYDVKNTRSVWTVCTEPYKEAHFATFPTELIEPCIKAGCPEDGHVLDPFGGSGTTGIVADRLGRDATLIELNENYAEMIRNRVTQDAGMFAKITNGFLNEKRI